MRYRSRSFGSACALLLLAGCASAPQKPTTGHPLAAIVSGKSAVFCLKGDTETKLQIEAEVVKKMRSQGFDATEGRHVIPPSASYSAEDLATFLRQAGIRSIAEITYGGAVTSAAPDIEFRWLSESSEKHYLNTPMGLDAALRTLIDSLGSNPKRD